MKIHEVNLLKEKKKKKLSVCLAVPPAPVRVPGQTALAPNVASVTSVANKGDNEMILEAVHRSLGISLTAEENLMRPCHEGAVRPGIASNGVSFLQMGSLFFK